MNTLALPVVETVLEPKPCEQKVTITIARQLGSLGNEIAQRAAALLGFRMYRREVINQAALRAGAPEAALAAIDELGLLKICPSPEICHAYHEAVRQVMVEISSSGGVIIVGRAGQVILKDHPCALHVRIIAPLELRAERIASRQNIHLDFAFAQVKASDKARRKYLKQFYQADWDDPGLYDLIINTRQMSAEDAAMLIREAAYGFW